MLDQPERPKCDPRSPVQPGENPARYLIVAAIAAFMVWTAIQNWSADSQEHSASQESRRSPQYAAPETARSAKGDLRAIFSADDYPASAQANGEEGTVQAELRVDTTGRVSRCEVIRSSGHPSLDDATCKILEKRARFIPAHDSGGNPVISTVTTPPVRWELEP
jgi:TonB family protein